MRQLVTPEGVSFAATLQTQSHDPSLPHSEVRGLLRSSLLISGRDGVPSFRTDSTPGATPENERPPSLSLLFSFPWLLQLRPHSFPAWSPPSPLHALGKRGVTRHYPQSDARQTEGRASGPVFPPPGVCKLLTFISRLERPHDLASAQAHLVSSKKATAFPSPRRPSEQWPISEHKLMGGAPRRAEDVNGSRDSRDAEPRVECREALRRLRFLVGH